MQVYLSCSDCLRDYERHLKATDSKDHIYNQRKRLSTYAVQLTNDISYEVRCDFGHSSAVFINMFNHEILFEIGVHSFLDGYYREAVTSFAASLERFYEFAIRSIAIHYGLPGTEELKCWKSISSQSERQLGSYIYLHAIHFKGQPKLLSQDKITLRNSSIHKGQIPTYEEAMEFGEEVLSILSETSLKIWKTIPVAANKVVNIHAQNSIKKITDTGGTQSGDMICVDSAIRGNRSLKEHIKRSALRHSRDTIEKHKKLIAGLEDKHHIQ
ncbi:hypothetical protein [Pseudomonas fluorescens]|uniref:Uncharacterized protein n=1 Tax=Pseudomonas fluorescens TaxID=294 RepID=A0A5E7HJR0_PSEFL|nr:hypothetical protein [Pseudomonas fluorescens]VVO64208.1 hypothetical protein PS847_00962 [Pseudomonas fluorescens]